MKLEDLRPHQRRMALPTYDDDGVPHSVGAGDTISACVRRPGGRQMYWHPATIIGLDGDRALVELANHPGERALLGPRNIRVRMATTPTRGGFSEFQPTKNED